MVMMMMVGVVLTPTTRATPSNWVPLMTIVSVYIEKEVGDGKIMRDRGRGGEMKTEETLMSEKERETKEGKS